MPNTMTENKPSLADFNVRKADQSARDARREEISAIEKEFYDYQASLSSPQFVKINDLSYHKSTLEKITFGDTFIYARFSTGDVIEITREQLFALTS